MARTKTEKQENAVKKSRGRCLEIYQRVTISGEAINKPMVSEVDMLVLVAGESEGCRDVADVKAVLVEKNLTGQFVAVRRSGDVIERVKRTVCSFVTPKSWEDCKEVPLKEDD